MSIAIGTLHAAQLADAIALSTGEGWNQTETDWRRLLRLAPGGCFGAWVAGRLAGTVTTTIHDPTLAWIGMMIVHPAARRRGIGAALMTRAVDHLEAARVSCVKLDATPAGAPLYRRLGFEEEVLFERWMGVARPIAATDPALDPHAELDPMLPLDRTSFGADRSPLLAMLEAEALATYVSRESDSNAEGYALARPGRIATYLGPVVGTGAAVAARLLDALLARFAGRPVCIDVNTAGLLDRAHLETSGLAATRPLMRMRRGGTATAGTPATLCASAGPEYG